MAEDKSTILIGLMALALCACRNDIADIRAITDKNTKPVQTSYGASYTFSEKGKKQTRLEAGVLELPQIFINGGRRGFLVGITPSILSETLGAKPVHCAL
jgi:hypothetical protein